MRTILSVTLPACLALLWTNPIHAEALTDSSGAPFYDTSVCSPDGIALGGYDPVSYHAADGPVSGSEAFAVSTGSVTYLFANAEHQSIFEADPEKYIPSYLGWCSTNLSMGRLACPDFTNYKIENGKLLLFEHAGFTNGRDVWNANPRLHRKQADANQIKFSQ